MIAAASRRIGRAARGVAYALACALALFTALFPPQTRAQIHPQTDTPFTAFNAPDQHISKPAQVQFLYPEQVTVPAGKPSLVILHFRVAPGLHINSHSPLSAYLIPTVFSIPTASGVRLDRAVYPPGTEFVLPLDPKTKLSVYTGEFRIRARITAAAGDHLVQAQLRFQACEVNICLPPATIIAAIDVIGK